MIDPKELRIGNWINAYHNDVQVTSINSEPDHLSLQISTTPTLVGSTHGGMYFPIPLTEEWLIKFGFDDKRGYMYPSYRKDLLLVYGGPDNEWTFIIGRNLSAFESDPHIMYVHQLQNLYFSLTGEELTIKE